ncbi:alpha-L-fucosidase [Coraliomargarita sinensis]|uniref:alpha-L-fucosidase n=1 Tax=Coraliomargarita sinensis TaxID=2174842 RepID=A0A317ZIE3_9BACT|nr:alpha-L-fucosidase [Coraliomargarita sinensis]PXA03539.1 alpha-L-fucosidase [Coraliomargarita sinensis]
MMQNSLRLRLIFVFAFAALATYPSVHAESMDEMWGEQVAKLKASDGVRGQLFEQGNYAMFIHWGLYSQIANKYQGETYYGIGEWIMHPRMADIPVEDYKTVARDFNPVHFDADAIAQLAVDAGMKYIVITSKHHDGFAMYDSEVNDFNIVDATPYGRDPMKELAEACAKHGLGLGFYYSHNQDWTFPGGTRGPAITEGGEAADFTYYYENKCRPQVEEITTKYGPIEIVWFDTPGRIPKDYVEELVAIVRKNQPGALVSGRAGYGLGDYKSHGDMEVPHGNVDGLWETVDTTNDSWSYAWYDTNWKTPKQIIERLVATVARGGTYMLNIGPRGDGTVPVEAQLALRKSGEWIRRYPFVVYGTGASPWGHALPWGDVTVKDNRLYLSVFNLPDERTIYLPGLKTELESVTLIDGGEKIPLPYSMVERWTRIQLPPKLKEALVPVIEVELSAAPEVDSTWGLDPSVETTLLVEFADVERARKSKKGWMEKFGEWKHVVRAHEWEKGGQAFWDVDVLEPGYYQVALTYSGEGRLVWKVGVADGEAIQNEQNSSHNYQQFPIGWIEFPETGRYTIHVSCIEGDLEKASLKSVHFTKVDL